MDDVSRGGDADSPRVAVEAAAGSEGTEQLPDGRQQPAADRPVRAAILELLATPTGATDASEDPISNLQQQRKHLLDERKRLTKQLKTMRASASGC